MNINEEFNCLVCNKVMQSNHQIAYIDYSCHRQDDHHFSWRIVHGNLAKLRIRFKDGSERLVLKIHYDEDYSEVWTMPDSVRLKVNQIIIPNFEDVEKLKNKIRTILVFS
jgi:ribosomal protein L32E